VTSVIFWLKRPPVPLIRKMRSAKVKEPTITVIPTFNSDHLSCF
jgi:hypothetical protein